MTSSMYRPPGRQLWHIRRGLVLLIAKGKKKS